MQPTYEKVPLTGERLYLFWKRAESAFAFRWHYHPEYELTLITRGRGTRIVGDHVAEYREGDLVLLGPNLPHTWSSTPSPSSRKSGVANEAYVLQFSSTLFGEPFLKQPDMSILTGLLQRSGRGLLFGGVTRDRAEALLRASHEAASLKRFARLFELFDLLASSKDARSLATTDAGAPTPAWRSSQTEHIYRYIHGHALEHVGLEAVARHFNMTPSTLHRQLKRATGRSLTELINDLRISHACNLLAHTDRQIAEICYQCGYQNLSYFNRRFLAQKNVTPREYRRQLKGDAGMTPSERPLGRPSNEPCA